MMDAKPDPRRLGPASRAALRLLACCPRIPTDVAARLLGCGHPGSAAQLLARLRAADLVRVETVAPGLLLGSRRIRLWSLTARGRAIAAERVLTPSDVTVGSPYGVPARVRDPSRQPNIPLLIAAYRLLAAVAPSLGPRARVRAWEHPWVRSFRPAGSARMRHL